VESVVGTNGDRPAAEAARPLELAVKRTVDTALAAAGLVVLSPVLAALAAVILVEDGRPVLFRQERAGRDGKPFTIFKFRTMIRDAHAHGDGYAVNEGDDRILRSGDFYRRFGLDELPQLWNVLRGEMSLIGPRPTLVDQVERYTARQRVRLRMRPGVTGWSQIHGRTSIPWSRRIELDVWYVEHWSLRLDARILWRTLGQMTRPEDTYKGATGGWDL
jgi:lipopolysaccharide/colanic/teichoic acid biosynthesis glycosyltransferase